MKKLYRKLAITLSIVTFLGFIALAANAWVSTVYDADAYLGQLLTQMEMSSRTFEKEYNTKVQLVKEDYLNRAYAIGFIVENDKEMLEFDNLRKLRDTLNVADIYLMDASGKVVYSTRSVAIGRKMNDCGEDILSMLRDDDAESQYVHLDEVDYEKRPEFFHIFVRSDSEDFAALRIDIDVNKEDFLSKNEQISRPLRQTPTDYDTTIAAVDVQTGEIIGITENNQQTMHIGGRMSAEKVRAYLEEHSTGEAFFAKINGKINRAVVYPSDRVYLIAYKDINSILLTVALQFAGTLVLMLILTSVVLAIIRTHLKKHLFDDLDSVQNSINEILNGNYEVDMGNSDNEELAALIEAVQDLKQGYIHKAERMNKIFNTISEDIGVFECLPVNSQSEFFSENLQRMFEIDDENWAKMRGSKHAFESFIGGIAATRDEDGIVHYKNHYLEIHTYRIKGEFIGVIIDRTKDKKEEERIRVELEDAKLKASHDKLTGLYNREGFEKRAKEYLDSENPVGAMILFDLDNFKRVNDSEGHPTGDKVLQIFGESLAGGFRRSDIIGRLGGDEFIAVLPNSIDEETLLVKINEIHESIRLSLSYYYKKYGLSVSSGVIMINKDNKDYTTLYGCADTALYIAKQLGKNRTYVNHERIACMKKECEYCRDICPRRDALNLERKHRHPADA